MHLTELQPGTAVDPERVQSIEDSSYKGSRGPVTLTTVRLFDGRHYAIERPYAEVLALINDQRRTPPPSGVRWPS